MRRYHSHMYKGKWAGARNEQAKHVRKGKRTINLFRRWINFRILSLIRMDLRQCLCLLISRWCLFLSFLLKLRWFLAVKSDRARRNVSFFLVLYFVGMKLFFAWFSFLENLIICPVLSIRFHRNPHTIFIEEYKASLETDKLLFSLKRYLWE